MNGWQQHAQRVTVRCACACAAGDVERAEWCRALMAHRKAQEDADRERQEEAVRGFREAAGVFASIGACVRVR